MAITFNTTASLNVQNNLRRTSDQMNKSLERLSTGLRINHASDDPAGITLMNNLNKDIRGMAAAEKNIQLGNSLLETSSQAISAMIDVVNQYRELAIEAAGSGVSSFTPYTNSASALMAEVSRLSDSTEFNGNKLLDGTVATLTLQIGWKTTSDHQLSLTGIFADSDATALGLTAITSAATASTAITNADAAIVTLNNKLTNVGSYQSVLDSHLGFIQTTQENYTAALSTIRDADVAEESANLSRLQVLQQAGASMLSTANQLPAIGLTLLN